MNETEIKMMSRVVAETLVECIPPLLERVATRATRRWLRPNEAAEYLCVSRTHLFELIRQGALPRCKHGHKTVFDKKDLDAFWRKRKYKENPDV